MTRPLLRFLVIFVLGFSLLLFAYLQIPDDFLRLWLYPRFVVQPSLFLLEHTSSSLQVHYLNNLVYLGDKSLEIVRGCDGSGFLFIYIAAVIAYPAGWLEKFFGLLGGVLVLWAINIFRISCLIYLKKYFDNYFYLIHNLVSPMLFCLLSLSIFWIWMIKADKTQSVIADNEK